MFRGLIVPGEAKGKNAQRNDDEQRNHDDAPFRRMIMTRPRLRGVLVCGIPMNRGRTGNAARLNSVTNTNNLRG